MDWSATHSGILADSVLFTLSVVTAPFSVNVYTKRTKAALHSHYYIISNISGVTVQRSSGEVNILAKTVVSSISLKATFTKLIPKQVAQKSRNNI